MLVDWNTLIGGLVGGGLVLLINAVRDALRARADSQRQDKIADADVRNKDAQTEDTVSNQWRKLYEEYRKYTDEQLDEQAEEYEKKLKESREECERVFGEQLEQRDAERRKDKLMIEWLDNEVLELRDHMVSLGLNPPPRKRKPDTGELKARQKE